MAKRKRVNGETTPAGQSILRGVHELIAWVSGEDVPVRETIVHVPRVNVRDVRAKTGLSQREFAAKFGFKLATVRNWEQGRREPERPARILLAVVEQHPELVEEVLTPKSAA